MLRGFFDDTQIRNCLRRVVVRTLVLIDGRQEGAQFLLVPQQIVSTEAYTFVLRGPE